MAIPWKKNHLPKRILVIRLQAMGDVVITLPYLQSLRNSLPGDTIIDFLTREETDAIPKNLVLFDRIYSIKGKRNFKKQFLYTLALMPRLFFNRYDVVIDLQNNQLSKFVRKIIRPDAWCEFDKYSPMPAGERNRKTIESAGLGNINADNHFKLRSIEGITELLLNNGWEKGHAIVILNPAGAFENRNWPIGRYAEFAQHWLQQFPQTQFLMLGVNKIEEKAKALQKALGDKFINLVNKTSPAQAFAMIQRAKFVLSEDSGLMHMAWVSGIPTLVIFGSTRSDWAQPLGRHTAFLDSSDMTCGNCMLEICKLDEAHKNLCMTRYDAGFIFDKAMQLLNNTTPG